MKTTGRSTATRKNKKSPRPKKTAPKPPTTLERWQRVADAAVDGTTQSDALFNMLDMATEMPTSYVDPAAYVTAVGMIHYYDVLTESGCEILCPKLRAGTARMIAWLTSQVAREAIEWPVELVSRCLREGPKGWGAAFDAHIHSDDNEGLKRLEMMNGIRPWELPQ